MDSNKKRKLDDTKETETKEDLEKNKRLKKVENILERKKRINSVIYSLERNLSLLRDEIRDIDNKLYNVCPHEWVRDWDTYEPCGRTPKICKHCQL